MKKTKVLASSNSIDLAGSRPAMFRSGTPAYIQKGFQHRFFTEFHRSFGFAQWFSEPQTGQDPQTGPFPLLFAQRPGNNRGLLMKFGRQRRKRSSKDVPAPTDPGSKVSWKQISFTPWLICDSIVILSILGD